MPPAGLVNVLRIDLGQRDERAAVIWPAVLLRQLRDRCLVSSNIRTVDALWHHRQCVPRRACIPKRLTEAGRWVNLQFHQAPHAVERVAKHESSTVDRAE